MNELAEQLCDGLLMTEETVGAVMSWNGQDYPCVGGSELRGKKLDLGGWQFHSDTVVIVRTAVFGDGPKPAEKQTLLYTSTAGAEARKWRIDSVRTLYGAIMLLECNDPNQAA